MTAGETGEDTARKEAALNMQLQKYSGAVIAFSGGVDSAFLLYKAKQVYGPQKVLAVTVASEFQPGEEIVEARETAGFMGIKHLLLSLEMLSREEIVRNTPLRCYYCKCEIFKRLLGVADRYGLPAVLEGSNYDDLDDYRPGLIAAREYGIGSPLLEAGLVKQEIRLLSHIYGLPTSERIASPCLATRFPYGEHLDGKKLQRVARAERYLKQLGFKRELRVRSQGEGARIVVPVADQAKVLARSEQITHFLKQLGFVHIALDLEGFKTIRRSPFSL